MSPCLREEIFLRWRRRFSTTGSRPASGGQSHTVSTSAAMPLPPLPGGHLQKHLSPRSPSPPRTPLRGVLSVLLVLRCGLSSRSSPRRPPKTANACRRRGRGGPWPRSQNPGTLRTKRTRRPSPLVCSAHEACLLPRRPVELRPNEDGGDG